MPAYPSEPEKYSIDEMMDRLKSTSSGDPSRGELVTRADGTQAIRVRKRKRRTEQPHKTEQSSTRRIRVIQITAITLLVTLVSLGIGAAVIYANSPSYRNNLRLRISETIGANVDFQQFRMNPKSANAAELRLTWPEGNVLGSLTLAGVNAEIFPSTFIGRPINGEEITVTQGNLDLRIPAAGKALTFASAGSAAPDFEPIHFNRYRINHFFAKLGNRAAPVMALAQSEASFFQNPLNGRPQFSLKDGDLSLKGWPALRIDRAFFEFRGNEIDVISLRLSSKKENQGVFELSGTIFPYSPDRPSSLGVHLKSFPISGLTGPSLGRLIQGKIDSFSSSEPNSFTFYPRENASPEFKVAFRSSLTSAIELSGFPFLDGLRLTLEDDWFQHPVFDGEEAGGTIEREAGIVSLKNINLVSKGRLAIRGSLSLDESTNAMSGNLEVGVYEAMLGALKSTRLNAMFGPSVEGFRWVSLKVGGQAASPADDFAVLYGKNPEVQTTAPDPAQQPPTFEELSRPR